MAQIDSHEDKIEPILDAFLLCEGVDEWPDGTITINKIFPSNEVALQKAASVTLTLFTRWGSGRGSFVQWIRLTRPNGAREDLSEARFQLQDQVEVFDSHAHVDLDLAEPGAYRFDLILDGFPVVEKVVHVTLPDRAY